MTPFQIVIRVIASIIIAFILLYGFFYYVDKIIEDKHKEMLRKYEHSCNGGLTDDEIKEMEKK